MTAADIAQWTLFVAVATFVAAILVPVGLYLFGRWRRAEVRVTSVEGGDGSPGRIHIVIRNRGEADLMIAGPGFVVIEPRSQVWGREAAVKPTIGQIAYVLKNGEIHSHFPLRLQSGDEVVTDWVRTHFSDDVWMADCVAPCYVRGVYETTTERLFRSAPFSVPFEQWLPEDASARKLKPRP